MVEAQGRVDARRGRVGRVLGRHRHRRMGRRRCRRSSRARRSPPASRSRRRSTPRSTACPACSPAPPTSPATPAPSSPTSCRSRSSTPAAGRCTTASASTRMGSTMVGMATHGGILPAGGTFFVFLDYMRPPVRLAALSQAKVVFVLTPRLGRRRRGRSDAPADRAARHAAGDPPAAGHPPGRRQRDRRRVEGRRRPRRPDRAGAQPPEHHRCAPTARPSSRGAGGRSPRPTTRRWCSSAPAARWRCASRPPSSSPPRASAPAWSACRRGTGSPRRTPTYQDDVLPAGVPVLSVEAARHVRLGALRRRIDRHRPLRRQRTRATSCMDKLGINVDQRRGSRHAAGSGKGVIMDRLAHLYHEFGQSPWLDNLKRGYITSGQLRPPRRQGHPRPHQQPDDLPEGDPGLARLRRAVPQAGRRRPPDHRRLLGDGARRHQRRARRVRRAVPRQPRQATASPASRSPPTWPTTAPAPSAAARHLHEQIHRPNLMVKIPAHGRGRRRRSRR